MDHLSLKPITQTYHDNMSSNPGVLVESSDQPAGPVRNPLHTLEFVTPPGQPNQASTDSILDEASYVLDKINKARQTNTLRLCFWKTGAPLFSENRIILLGRGYRVSELATLHGSYITSVSW